MQSDSDDLGKLSRDEALDRLRNNIVNGLAEATGKADIAMHWEEYGYVDCMVCGEGKMLEGWPGHIPFGELCRIRGGAAPFRELLALWSAGILRWRDATAEDLRKAELDHRSVLPSTPVPPRPRGRSAPHTDAQWIVGTLTMHVATPAAIRCKSPPPDARTDDESVRPKKRRRQKKPADDNAVPGPSAKRHRRDRPPTDTPSTLRFRLGQRSNNNTAPVRRFCNVKNGVKTPQWILEDDSAPGGYIVLPNELGLALEEGRAVLE
ncbi:hypothetical protein K466DRAFT_559226 [Polyporus arcularius HHB13444]|uniref:Uncharacterized protein n=1 Tax=Polyporus arcularius HHB13444 TaxID=1314778 RepID=A0A5C3NSQ4_9APHY|nr:hypothetical protein K466DRAFT_559226 [Polyporus arcularius HHB13444]